MSFSDDDLKRLKKIQAHQPYLLGDLERIMSLQVPALLSRLECAETYLNLLVSLNEYEKPESEFDVLHKAWLKSKGETK